MKEYLKDKSVVFEEIKSTEGGLTAAEAASRLEKKRKKQTG